MLKLVIPFILFSFFDVYSQTLSLPPSPAKESSITERLAILFHNQLSVFPQEKIYIHIDKPYYITGEKIWFRTHLVYAENHIPVSGSQYVYVELFNPLDMLVNRVKIRNNNGAYHGYMDIPQDIPEGDYMLRAYTKFMLNLDEHYISAKTVRIINPKYRMVRVDTKYTNDEDGNTNADFHFFSSVKEEPVVPKSVQMSINYKEMMSLEVHPDGTSGVNFNMSVNDSKRVLLLEVNDPVYPCQQFIQIPAADWDFDVTFYPEGGSLLQGAGCRVAFKALKSDGRAANVEGVVYDQHGNEKARIRTDYMGMGAFILFAEEGVTYHAVVKNDRQQTKQFELPAVQKKGYTLSVTSLSKDNIYVTVLKPATGERHETLYLLAHTRGKVYAVAQWDDGKLFTLPKKQFPSGVLHLVLYDANLSTVSERLVFVNHNDQAQVSYSSDRDCFSARLFVSNRVKLTDHNGHPLSGSFSVSVTDNHTVTVDSATNILTQLLLTSDLRGNIEKPADYFTNDHRSSAMSLDLLMLTQGWRRYDVAALAQGKLAHPAIPIELSAEISGVVKGGLFNNKLLEKSKVSIVTSDASWFDLEETDSEGRFSFRGCDLPDSTALIVRAASRSDNTKVMLFVDEETFPKWTLPILAPDETEQETFLKYVEQVILQEQNEKRKAKEEFWDLGELSEVAIIGKRPVPKSVVRVTYHLDEEQIKGITKHNINALLEHIPDVTIVGGSARLYVNYFKNRSFGFTKLIIDDEINKPLVFERNIYEILTHVDPGKVKSIYRSDIHSYIPGSMIIKDDNIVEQVTAAPQTELIIICSNVYDIFYNKQTNIKQIQPLGYQKPLEFYTPKYDTPEAREKTTYDLLSTIHWQPNVRTDDLGMAAFGFYTADTESSYTVVIEGMTTEGKIIRHKEKILIQDAE